MYLPIAFCKHLRCSYIRETRGPDRVLVTDPRSARVRHAIDTRSIRDRYAIDMNSAPGSRAKIAVTSTTKNPQERNNDFSLPLGKKHDGFSHNFHLRLLTVSLFCVVGLQRSSQVLPQTNVSFLRLDAFGVCCGSLRFLARSFDRFSAGFRNVESSQSIREPLPA